MAPNTTGDVGSILGVWGHPDDEAYLSAGLMRLAIEAGRRVTCVTATCGEAGFADDDPRSTEERKTIRKAEMAASLAELGVTEHHWMGHGDGACAEVPDGEAVAVVRSIIEDVQPDTLLTFGPDGATGHPDHIAVCRWSTLACAALARDGGPTPRLLYATKSAEWNDEFFAHVDPADVMMIEGMRPEAVPTDEMAVWFTCEGELLERKARALRAQASQIDGLVAAYGHDAFVHLVREEFFRSPRPSDRPW
jgi:LmbE family N-acetylglucosaminyl deacetylase